MSLEIGTERGQRVTVSADHDFPASLLGQTFVVAKVKETKKGGDAFCLLERPDGRLLKHTSGAEWWFRRTELQPAPAIVRPGKTPIASREESVQMSASRQLINLATTLEKTEGLSYREAQLAVGHSHPELVDAYEDYFRSPSPASDEPAKHTVNLDDSPALVAVVTKAREIAQQRRISPKEAIEIVLADRVVPNSQSVISLRRELGETFDQIVSRTAIERTDGDHVAAYHLAAAAFPELVLAHSRGETL